MDQLRQRPEDQALPTASSGPTMHDLVIGDLEEMQSPGAAALARMLSARAELGYRRYGQVLQAHNGRDAVRDAVEEIADFLVYLRQVDAETPTVFGPALNRLALSLGVDLLNQALGGRLEGANRSLDWIPKEVSGMARKQ